ncbi:DnaJ/Hsp40 cysteine-rich domain superfamily protein [Quillaja saponaria]|uniref:DnaJ/Hsp40 cysteine-rich domain superfamily protein n=1 Tax=Quillaja saponaria TaxID=32244 RepID=A0AAD7Q7R3_QUISA|nr:DnaJ/Hsp40 cysteine-rich domain superfamily protein [Quillaja saponaria]
MDSSALKMASSINGLPYTSNILNPNKKINFGFLNSQKSVFINRVCAIYSNGSVSRSSSHGVICARLTGDVHRRRRSLESLFCYDKEIPEERIEKPIGLSSDEKVIGDNPRCADCQAKGAVLCTTCSGSGLYVDAILEPGHYCQSSMPR